MEQIPPLVLAALYWLHMLATVVWLGGLAAFSIFVLPAAHSTLEPAAYSKLLGKLQERLQQVGWLCLAVLGATGLFQLSANVHYSGLLNLNSSWAVAIFIKHVMVLVMVAGSAYSTWGVLPALRRTALLRSAGREVDAGQAQALERREMLILRGNLALSILVLALTAFARSV
jgi:uncharacterized membrane protein